MYGVLKVMWHYDSGDVKLENGAAVAPNEVRLCLS
jgi:hypothetical protein